MYLQNFKPSLMTAAYWPSLKVTKKMKCCEDDSFLKNSIKDAAISYVIKPL